MKVGIIGSRDLLDKEFVYDTMDRLKMEYGHFTVLLGGAAGVQDSTKDWCNENNGWDYVLFKPWHLVDTRLQFEPRLFFMRNKQIVDNSDMVVVIRTDKEDSEVDRAQEYAQRKPNKDVVVLHYSSEEEAA